jgi:hypothetical protein
VSSHAAESTIVGMSAKPSRMRKSRARKPTCFTGTPYGRARVMFPHNIQGAPGSGERVTHDARGGERLSTPENAVRRRPSGDRRPYSASGVELCSYRFLAHDDI